ACRRSTRANDLRSWLLRSRDAPRDGAAAGQAQLPDQRERLEEDLLRHLRLADAAIYEDDGHFFHAQAVLDGAVGHLDLEAVALRAHAIEIELLERGAAEALEAPGQIAHADAEDRARVERAAARDELAHRAPIDRAAAVDVARAEHQVGAGAGARQHDGQVLGVVREVAIHLEEELVVAGQGPLEAGDVGGAEPLLAGAV